MTSCLSNLNGTCGCGPVVTESIKDRKKRLEQERYPEELLGSENDLW